jgi:hypothetical protein
VWRRRAETGPEVCWIKGEFPPKVMVFGGFAKDYKSTLFVAESGTVNAESHVDHFVDQSGIPDMNQCYGHHKWTYMQDGALVHITSSTMAYTKAMATVIEDWPACSPDLNPIENLWAIMKRRLEKFQLKTKDDLISVVFEAWKTLEIALINALIESTSRRIALVIENGGE